MKNIIHVFGTLTDIREYCPENIKDTSLPALVDIQRDKFIDISGITPFIYIYIYIYIYNIFIYIY